jgi:hypothetical protein
MNIIQKIIKIKKEETRSPPLLLLFDAPGALAERAVVGTLLLEAEAGNGEGEGPSSPPPLPLPPFFFNSCCSSKLFFRDVVVSPALGVVSGGGVGVGVDDNVLGIAIFFWIFLF